MPHVFEQSLFLFFWKPVRVQRDPRPGAGGAAVPRPAADARRPGAPGPAPAPAMEGREAEPGQEGRRRHRHGEQLQ